MICGPIISTDDLEGQTALYADCFGMKPSEPVGLPCDVTEQLCGETGVGLTSRWLSAEGTPFGVRIWSFDPPALHTVRNPQRGTDRDAPKVIDFYAPDFDGAINHLTGHGQNVKSSIAEYTIPAGTMREAHLWGPDHVVSAVISGPKQFFRDFATVQDRTFSEPQSISTPVSNIGQAVQFYADVFGLHPVYEYDVEHTSFDDLVGADRPIRLHAVNIGTSTREPYLGLIDYGTHQPGSRSLKGRVRPPVRGLVGVEMTVDDIDETIERAGAFGGVAFLGRPVSIQYPPFGQAKSVILEAPHGVLHHVVEQSTGGGRLSP